MLYETKMLGEVCEIIGGGTPSRDIPDYFTGDVPWATPTDVTALHGEKFITDTKEHITQRAIDNSATRLVPAGSVLMTSRATIGYTVINKRPMCTNQGFANFIPNKDVDSLYLAYYLEFIRDILIQRASGTTFKEISKSELRKIPIPLPSIEKQKKIGMNLKRITDCINKNREGQILSNAYPLSLFHKMFGNTETNPKHLPLKKLGEICSIKMGQSPPSSTYNTTGDGLPFFQGKADFGKVYPKTRIWCTEPSKIAEKDSILMSVRAPVGPTNIAKEKCCIGRGLVAIKPTPTVTTWYTLYSLRVMEPDIATKGSGSTFTAINKVQVSDIDILLPPIGKQKEFDNKITSFEKARVVQHKSRELLGLLFASLSNKYFNIEGGY